MKIEKILRKSVQKTLVCGYRNTAPDVRLAWKEILSIWLRQSAQPGSSLSKTEHVQLLCAS
jgi:hypothetical protein